MRLRYVCTCGAGLGGETADDGTSGSSCLAKKLWLENLILAGALRSGAVLGDGKVPPVPY